jgi:hypothetical protein
VTPEQIKSIVAFAEALETCGPAPVARALHDFASFLADMPDTGRTQLINQGQALAVALRPNSWSANEPVMASHVGTALCRLAAIVETTGGQPPRTFATKLRSLAKLLIGISESELFSARLNQLRVLMTPPPLEQQIAIYVERLKSQTGTPAFDRTHQELTASDLRKEAVIAIANAVYGKIPNSTSRVRALAFIRKPHDARVATKLGNDAMGGRSAA